MKLIQLIVFTVLVFVTGFGQQNGTITDLKRQLQKSKEDTSKVSLYVQLGFEYEGSDLEKAKYYYRKSLDLSKKLDYIEGEIKFVHNYGYVLNLQGFYDSSLLLNLHSIELAKKSGNKELLAKSLFNTGSSYRLKEMYETASTYYQRAYQMFEKIGNKSYLAQADDILQNLYKAIGNFEKGVHHGEQALKYYRATHDSLMLCQVLNNLSLNYNGLNKYAKAKVLMDEAVNIAIKIENPILESTSLLNLATYYMFLEEYDAIKPYFERTLLLAEELDLNENKAISLKGLALYHLYKEENNRALEYAMEALEICKDFDFKDERKNLYDIISNIYFSLQNSKKGFEYETMYSNLSDSILNNAILRNVQDLETKYQLQKKEDQIKIQEIKIQQKTVQNQLLIVISIGLILVFVLVYVNYHNHKKLQQKRINDLEKEKQLLATQSLLKGQDEERSRLAKDLHDGLGGLLSGVKLQLGSMKGNLLLTEDLGMAFDRALLKLDESITEMRRVAHNMMPEALLNLGLKQAVMDYCFHISHEQPFTISVEIHGVETITDHAVQINVYRMVQELVNNAVKHSNATEILVQIMVHESEIVEITVEDNGHGFDQNKVNILESSGLRNVQTRVNYLKGSLDIQSKIGMGTSFFIVLKLENHGQC